MLGPLKALTQTHTHPVGNCGSDNGLIEAGQFRLLHPAALEVRTPENDKPSSWGRNLSHTKKTIAAVASSFVQRNCNGRERAAPNT